MKKLSKDNWDDLRDKIIGLGEKSIQKSYYPELQQRLHELEIKNLQLNKKIEERKQAEQALRESEEKYRSLFEESRDAIVLTTQLGKFIDANSAALELFGYTKEEILKMNFQKLYVDPDEGYRFQKEMKEKDSVQDFETKLRRKDGVEMDCIFDVVCRQGDDGKILKYQGIIRDISEAKRAQEALKASQQHLTQILNFLPNATMVIDNEGKVVTWNHAMERMTGVKAEDILGKGNYEYALPFYGERRPVLIDLVRKWDEETAEKYQHVKRQGEALVSETYDCLVKPGGFLRNKASLLYDSTGEVMGAIESIRDISDRKRAEEKLQYQKAYFEGLVDNMPDSIAIFDDDGTIMEVNSQFIRMFGYPEEEALGQNISELVGPPDRLEEAHSYRRRIASGEIMKVETVRKSKDGALIDVSLRSAPVIIDNTIIGHFVIYRDISARKQAEKEKSGLESQLQQARKMEAIATLAGGVAHEFNNALMGILGNIELLKMDLPEDERRDRYFGAMKDSGHRMSRLTDQLLAYAQGGKHQPKNLKLDSFVIQTL